MHLISENNELFEEKTRLLFSQQEAETFRGELLKLVGQLFQTDYVSLLISGKHKQQEYAHPVKALLGPEVFAWSDSFGEPLLLSSDDHWPDGLKNLKQAGLNLLLMLPVGHGRRAAMVLGWQSRQEVACAKAPELERLKGRLDELISFYFLLEQQQVAGKQVPAVAASAKEKLSSLLISTFPGLLMLLSKEGRILNWSEQTERLLGYSKEQLNQMHVLELFPSENQELSRKIMAEAFEVGYASMENSVLSMRGPNRSFSFSLHHHQQQAEQGLLLQAIDISHSKQLEGSLRKISNHLKHIINNDILAYVKWNRRFEVLDWSEKSVKTFGWSLEEVKGKHILGFKFIHPDEKDKLQEVVEQFVQGKKESAKHEIKHITKNDRLIQVEWYTTAIKDEAGNVSSFLSLGNEVTERNHMEQALVETNQKLEALLTSSPVSIVTFDLNGRVTSWNTAAERIFGYAQGEVLGQEAPYARERGKYTFHKMIESVKDGTVYKDLLLPVWRKDESEIVLKVNLGPIRDQQGNIEGIIAVQEDVTEQEKLRTKLSEEKGYRENILQNLQTLIIACDAQGKINLCNSAASAQLKPGFIGLLPEDWAEFLNMYTPGGDRELQLSENPLYKALQGEWVSGLELMMSSGTGSRKIFSCNASPVKDSRGNKIGALLSMEDITEKKESLREFVGEKEFSDAILNSLPGIFYVINQQGAFIRWNSRMVETSGYATAEISQALAGDFIVPEDRERVMAALKEVFVKGEARVEASFLTKSGQRIPHLFTGHAFRRDGEHYLVGMGINISERKAAEESRERLVSILEATTDVVGVFNEDRQCLYLNAEGLKICGITNMARTSIYDCGPDWMNEMIDQDILPKADEKGVWRGEAALLDKEGREIPVSLVMIAHRTGPGRYYSMIARDISHQMRYEKKLTDQNEELKKINAELDRFVYSASHDLRAPLVSILGLINIARLSLNPQEFPQYLDLMEDRIGRLDTFIQDIEDFSRNSRLSVKKELIDFNALIEESRENLKFTKGAESVRLMRELAVSDDFYSDKSRLMIILNNLISNAIRYSDPEKEDSFIKVSVMADHKRAVIEVEDNGQGIEQQYQDKIFEMFFRAATNNVGSGLGLFIVKETLEKLGGSIRVESRLGEYTIFSLQIPNLKA